MNYQRARTKNQIEERINEIVDAAAVIYDNVGYYKLNFRMISERTELTRPSIYKYFKTKDEIMLHIIRKDIDSFNAYLKSSFKINRIYSLEEIADIITDTMAEHTRLLELYALLFVTIEKNTSVEALADFKKHVASKQDVVFDLFSELFNNATKKQLGRFATSMITLAYSLYTMSNVSNNQKEAIELSKTDYQPLNFKSTYRAVIYQLLYCLQNGIEI